jgi:short-subunit dehydrogenase
LLLKSIIVTGASSGIGKAAVINLIKSGYQVFGLARRYEQLIKLYSELPTDIKNANHYYFPIECDIAKPDDFEDIFNKIILKAREKTIFGIVNNAGYVEPGAIEDITLEDLRSQFETNFFGLIGFTKKVLPLMLKNNEGRIVNVSSISGLISLPLIGAYSATKFALEAISDALRIELLNTNIRVININPGLIETNIITASLPKIDCLLKKSSRFSAAYRKYLYKIPQGLPASSVANVIVEAISSTNPKYRYIVGSAKVKIGIKMRRYIPDKIFFSQIAKRIS